MVQIECVLRRWSPEFVTLGRKYFQLSEEMRCCLVTEREGN